MKQNKVLYTVLILVGIILTASYLKYATQSVQTFGLATASKIIIIDPGHGGFDPGKQGINGENEKDINLKIALKLRDYLEQSGATVVMTRTKDEDVDGMDGVKHKSKDMLERRKKSQGCDVLVSIHQNSFSQPKVKGAQVFYHKSSDNGKLLATFVQKSIREYVDTTNRREIKSSNDYYVLRTKGLPAIIVECGFLTNPEEEQKLNSEEYQDKMAWGIYLGIVKYFETIEIQTK